MSIAESGRLTAGWDELIGPGGVPRPAARALVEQIAALGVEELQHRRDLADLDVLTRGITFTVYADGRGAGRAWPFCGTGLVRDRDGMVYVLGGQPADPVRSRLHAGEPGGGQADVRRPVRGRSILPADDYPDHPHRLLCSLAPPEGGPDPVVVVLTAPPARDTPARSGSRVLPVRIGPT